MYVPVTIGLPSQTGRQARALFSESVSTGTVSNSFISHEDLVSLENYVDLELVVFFRRSVYSYWTQVVQGRAAFVQALESLHEIELLHWLPRICFVDCGTLASGPMSDLAVYWELKETASDHLEGRVSMHFYTIDFNGGIDLVAPKQFFDTASEVFIEHAANSLRDSLMSINS